MKKVHFSLENTVKYLVLLFGLSIFLSKIGIEALDPTQTAWVKRLGGDGLTEYNSWLYYRFSAWHFPVIGAMEGYDYPTKTGVGLTGAIPLLAIPLKTFSAWLPDEFQHFGWWFLICYVLQAYFAWQLMRVLLPKNAVILRGVSSLFFALSAPLLWRVGHINLSSHFLILAALWVYFSPFSARKKIAYFGLLLFLVSAVHQYLTVMLLGIATAALIDLFLRKKQTLGQSLATFAGFFGVIIFVFGITGVFEVPADTLQNEGFGYYSSNLNTFFNPFEYSPFLPAQKVGGGHYEGYAYMGLGFLILLAFLFLSKLFFYFRKTENAENQSFTEEKIRIAPIAAIAFLAFAFALSTTVFWQNKRVLYYDLFPFLEKICYSLRGSGRFIWIPFYLIMALGLRSFAFLPINKHLKLGILSFLMLIQFIDIKPVIVNYCPISHKKYEGYINYESFKPYFEAADLVVMYPPYYWKYNATYDFLDFATVAAFARKPITVGYFARPNKHAKAAFEAEIKAAIESNDLGRFKKSVFVTNKERKNDFDKWLKLGLITEHVVDNYFVFVPK